jgi:hypothetical protein
MKNCKVKEAEDHNFIPELVAFNGKIDCAAFLNEKNSGEKENTTHNV